MNAVKTSTLFIIAAVLVVLAALLMQLIPPASPATAVITNFDECAAAGYPIQETFPEQCSTPDGRTFVNEDQSGSSNSQATEGGCAIAGCSSQLCVEGVESDIVTTCEFRPEYACYQAARCERQATGRCDWAQTPELIACLQNPPDPDQAF